MKKLIVLFLVFILAMPCYATKRFKYGIVFNKNPFTPYNSADLSRVFAPQQRIYWLFMSKHNIKTEFIKVQIVTGTDKGPYQTFSGIVYTHEYKINKDSPHFFTDYVVLHSKGHYYMEIFDKNNLHKPLAVADFYVR